MAFGRPRMLQPITGCPMANPPTADLRRFLTEFFSDEELRHLLCFDYFRDVYTRRFAMGMAKGQNELLLLERCVRREALLESLAALTAERPAQYEARFGALPPAAAAPGATPSRARSAPGFHQSRDQARGVRPPPGSRSGGACGGRAWIAPDSVRPGEKWAEAISRGLEDVWRIRRSLDACGCPVQLGRHRNQRGHRVGA